MGGCVGRCCEGVGVGYGREGVTVVWVVSVVWSFESVGVGKTTVAVGMTTEEVT